MPECEPRGLVSLLGCFWARPTLTCCFGACIWMENFKAVPFGEAPSHASFVFFRRCSSKTMQRVCGISKAPHGFLHHPYTVVEEDLITMSSLRDSRSLLMKLQHEATCDFVSLPTNMIETICYFHTDFRARSVQHFEAFRSVSG